MGRKRAQIMDVAPRTVLVKTAQGFNPGKLLVPCHATLSLSFAQRSRQEGNGVGREE